MKKFTNKEQDLFNKYFDEVLMNNFIQSRNNNAITTAIRNGDNTISKIPGHNNYSRFTRRTPLIHHNRSPKAVSSTPTTLNKYKTKTGAVKFVRKPIGTGTSFKQSNKPLHESYNPALSSYLNEKSYKNIWLVADVHFFRKENSELNDINFKIPVQELMKNFKYEIKTKMKDDDVLLFLGDVAFRWMSPSQYKELQEFLKSCNCNKILIKGNHDTMNDGYYKKCGFMFVDKSLMLDDIIFTHIPVRSIQPFKLDGINYNIHGHCHGGTRWAEFGIDPTGHFDVWHPKHIFLNLEKVYNTLKRSEK